MLRHLCAWPRAASSPGQAHPYTCQHTWLRRSFFTPRFTSSYASSFRSKLLRSRPCTQSHNMGGRNLTAGKFGSSAARGIRIASFDACVSSTIVASTLPVVIARVHPCRRGSPHLHRQRFSIVRKLLQNGICILDTFLVLLGLQQYMTSVANAVGGAAEPASTLAWRRGSGDAVIRGQI